MAKLTKNKYNKKDYEVLSIVLSMATVLLAMFIYSLIDEPPKSFDSATNKIEYGFAYYLTFFLIPIYLTSIITTLMYVKLSKNLIFIILPIIGLCFVFLAFYGINTYDGTYHSN